MKKYDHKAIEKKWQDFWTEKGVYKADSSSEKPKKYILDMFPYPSGAGLHVGHPKGYIATDILSRMYRMQGFNVLHPMGWDAFGLPAEQFAIKNKMHPSIAVDQNVATFKEQLSIIGLDYDWERELNTTDPEYYKWTQWAFLQMFKKGLAFESHEPINWCPSCKTGLANEDLEDGRCERCGSEVEKKPLRQWVIRITDYADRMLTDLDKLDKWPESVKTSQRNWIGKSEGSEIPFVLSTGHTIQVFTTRADTLFGVTYIVLAPDHEFVQEMFRPAENRDQVLEHQVFNQVKNRDEIEVYITETKKKSSLDRQKGEKTGVELQGIIAVNPANGEQVPVWIADYVLGDYGTGAVMAVPAHDERDFEFAKKYNLPRKKVIFQEGSVEDSVKSMEQAFIELGTLSNSTEKFEGLTSEEAKAKITEFVGGKMKTSYKLRDWVFSRQRYWGEPIPLVHANGKVYPIPESELPLRLPEVENYEPSDSGESPLAEISEWVNVKGYINDKEEFVVAENSPNGEDIISGRRETNTMPQWAGSCWYYLRYIDPKNSEALVDKNLEQYWQPVDVYVGGMEHATRHLIYARFWHKFLFDIGVVNTEEPFTELHAPGLILAEDGRKMSKRWGNVINPDDMVDRFGADAFRLYEAFMGPFDDAIAWNTDGLVGTRRFIERVVRISENLVEQESESVTRELHKLIKKATSDIPAFKFNTAVSSMMTFVNLVEKEKGMTRDSFEKFIKILAPFAPHIAEELWQEFSQNASIHTTEWPKYDESKLVEDEVTIAVQINGKVRGKIKVAFNASQEEVFEQVKSDESITRHIDGTPTKIIYVQNKLMSIVI